MDRPLNILMVLHMPWNRNLGGARVQLELAEEFQALGHNVEKFDYYDAFPQAQSSFLFDLIRPPFAQKAKHFVKANAKRFDIVDAHQGDLPYSKQALNFKGLLVTRSVGLYTFYEEFARQERQQYPPQKLKLKLYQAVLNLRHQQEIQYCPLSFQYGDVINVPNQDEKQYLDQEFGDTKNCFVFPFGLSTHRQFSLASSALSVNQRLKNKVVAFIGTWCPRKGSKDWCKIIQLIRQEIPEVQFLFLGTGLTEKAVLEDLSAIGRRNIKIIPRYHSEELPHLLSGVTVGAFPSYIEGFGFAVLEKLASGIPTVAYDVPGPREMLRHFEANGDVMVKAGDIETFSQKIVDFLRFDALSYARVSQRCLRVAQRFSWSQIARETLDVYCQFLRTKLEE